MVQHEVQNSRMDCSRQNHSRCQTEGNSKNEKFAIARIFPPEQMLQFLCKKLENSQKFRRLIAVIDDPSRRTDARQSCMEHFTLVSQGSIKYLPFRALRVEKLRSHMHHIIHWKRRSQYLNHKSSPKALTGIASSDLLMSIGRISWILLGSSRFFSATCLITN